MAAPTPPNIVFIMADDMGLGDPGCYNPQSKIPTPHIDKLAAGGLRFTDAHTPAAVCTPTRYGVITGRYCWRRKKSGVLGGYSPPLIENSRPTIASILKKQGYTTACIGKWHNPFFLYLAPNAPHEPCVESVVPEFARGKSKAGHRGDLVWLFDWIVGQVVETLEASGQADNTMVIVTSDNGALPGDYARDKNGKKMSRPGGNWVFEGWNAIKRRDAACPPASSGHDPLAPAISNTPATSCAKPSS